MTRVELLPRLSATGLQPQRFVSGAAAWRDVKAAALDATKMRGLVQRRHEFAPAPTLEKQWTEAILEVVRTEILLEAPSRLGCLFAIEMGYDAFTILPELGITTSTFAASDFPSSGPMIIPARTRGPWVPVDMHIFRTPEQLTSDEAALVKTIRETKQLAQRYWTGVASTAPGYRAAL